MEALFFLYKIYFKSGSEAAECEHCRSIQCDIYNWFSPAPLTEEPLFHIKILSSSMTFIGVPCDIRQKVHAFFPPQGFYVFLNFI